MNELMLLSMDSSNKMMQELFISLEIVSDLLAYAFKVKAATGFIIIEITDCIFVESKGNIDTIWYSVKQYVYSSLSSMQQGIQPCLLYLVQLYNTDFYYGVKKLCCF